GRADTPAPVRADGEVHVDLAVLAPGHDHRIGAHVADYEVAGIGDLGLVPEEHPDLAEDLLHLQLVDLTVRQHAHLHFTGIGIDEVGNLGSVGQYRACSC